MDRQQKKQKAVIHSSKQLKGVKGSTKRLLLVNKASYKKVDLTAKLKEDEKETSTRIRKEITFKKKILTENRKPQLIRAVLHSPESPSSAVLLHPRRAALMMENSVLQKNLILNQFIGENSAGSTNYFINPAPAPPKSFQFYAPKWHDKPPPPYRPSIRLSSYKPESTISEPQVDTSPDVSVTGSQPPWNISAQERPNDGDSSQNVYENSKQIPKRSQLPTGAYELVQDSKVYSRLVNIENRYDALIKRKAIHFEDEVKQRVTETKKMRLMVTDRFVLPKCTAAACTEPCVGHWILQIRGTFVDEKYSDCTGSASEPEPGPMKKFSEYFESLIINLDESVYGQQERQIKWSRNDSEIETNGFQIIRPGCETVSCTILLTPRFEPMRYKLDDRLTVLVGSTVKLHTLSSVNTALWSYIQKYGLQDPYEHEFINCDFYLKFLFGTERIRFSEILQKLRPLLLPPYPYEVRHQIIFDETQNEKVMNYDLNLDVESPLQHHKKAFLSSVVSALSTDSSTSQPSNSLQYKSMLSTELQLRSLIWKTVEDINEALHQRKFFLSLSTDPCRFLAQFIAAQSADLKIMTDVRGSPEDERRSSYYFQPAIKEAVKRNILALRTDRQ